MRRFGQVTGLSPEGIEEYERLHAEVWPAVLVTIAASQIRNYSIFRYETLLFAYFEYVGDDFDADAAKMAADPETRRWWDVVGPLQRPVTERVDGEWWHTLPEVFHVA